METLRLRSNIGNDGGMTHYEDEHNDWSALSVQMLERAYGDYEPEYSADLIKEPNFTEDS